MTGGEKRLDSISWTEFAGLSPAEKAPYFARDGHTYNVIVAQQFSRADLDRVGDLATRIRRIAKSDEGAEFLSALLKHRRAMLYFTQPSSRTFLSFAAACRILGIWTEEVRDKATSSEVKGETRDDAIRTFSSYFDLIIMRSETGGLAERLAWVLANSDRPVPVINAGSGKDQHPTQALLDIYTLQRSFERRDGIDGKTIVFVGDLARGRTVRSLSTLLTNYEDVTQYFVAPEALQIEADIRNMLAAKRVKFVLSSDLDEVMPLADAIYMTRIQDEWDTSPGESKRIDISRYAIGARRLERLKPDAVLMHPLPRRTEISPEVDKDPRAVYWRQMRNGMWVRAALIATIFGRDGRILDYGKGAAAGCTGGGTR